MNELGNLIVLRFGMSIQYSFNIKLERVIERDQ